MPELGKKSRRIRPNEYDEQDDNVSSMEAPSLHVYSWALFLDNTCNLLRELMPCRQPSYTSSVFVVSLKLSRAQLQEGDPVHMRNELTTSVDQRPRPC